MKTAGDVLSILFDEGFVKKARSYSNLFDSWADITAKNGIAAAAAHSRIKELDRGILLVEMDHPGWKQILQTKQSKLLDDFRRRFPNMDIAGISLMLGKPGGGKPQECPQTQEVQETQPSPLEYSPEVLPKAFAKPETLNVSYDPSACINSIQNEELKEKLIKLGQVVKEQEKA